MFDSCLSLEEDLIEQGKHHGNFDGLQQGYIDGYNLGTTKGHEIGKELGFYVGCLSVWTLLLEEQPEYFTERSKTVLHHANKLLSSVGVPSSQDQRFFDNLNVIRSKFKLLLQMLGIHKYFRRKIEAPSSTF